MATSSSIASTSDLARQPPAFSTSASSNPSANRTAKGQYGYNALPKEGPLVNFVEFASNNNLPFFHHISPVIQQLPYKSALLDEAQSLQDAVEGYRHLVASGEVSEQDFAIALVCDSFCSYCGDAWLVSAST